MKRYLFGIFAILSAVVLLGILRTRNSPPFASKVILTPKIEAKLKISAFVQTITPAVVESPVPAAAGPWLDRLLSMQRATEMYGQYGESNFKEITDFVETIPADGLPDAINKMHELQAHNPTTVGHELLLRLLQQWSENDVLSASDWVTRMPPGDERREVVAVVANAWAQQNFGEANTWVEQLPSGPERQSAQECLAADSAFTSPMDSLKLACALPSSPTRDEIITRATATWAASAPENAVAWATQVSDDTLRQRVISGIAITWAESNPSSARDLAVNLLPAGSVQDGAMLGIVQRWMMIDAPGATVWVDKLPEGALRQAALGALNEYARRD
ncbi:MAG TPA: hypothetical protein VG938_07800 [Verrucomicrobiae bacterium]|jgi:hypothetical protein|nr:hypothetical protein [Verrucomicrobiae bacterium]